LGYLSRMRASGLVPSATVYHHLCACYTAVNDWQGAMAVWQDMVRQDMRPDLKTYQIVYAACQAAGAQEEANSIAEFAEREGVPLMAVNEAGCE